jgi:hypothetical protein
LALAGYSVTKRQHESTRVMTPAGTSILCTFTTSQELDLPKNSN